LAVIHIVSLELEPIHRLLGALVALGQIVGAPFGNLWCPNRGVGSRAGDLAPEVIHEHLCRTAVDGMDPMPGTDTAAIGTRRHVLGDREWGVDIPNAQVVNTENDQILRLEAVRIGRVRNGECAALHVINAGSMELGSRVAGARVFTLTNISRSLRTCPPFGGTLVASQLGVRDTTGREFEEIAVIRGVAQVAMEPPLIESVLLEGGHGPVVVGERLHGDIEPPHGGVVKGDVALHEGNRGGENGKEDLPHVSGRTSVQLTKECAEQQEHAATGNRKR